MSGRRSKRERRAQGNRPAYLMNADYARRSANAVLAVDLREVPLSRVSQFAIGWMRAAFEQSQVIASLTAAGKGHTAAPNRRVFRELALRLLWLRDMPQSAREEAVDTMLDHGRFTEATTDKHMREMGLESNIDIAAMEDFVLNASEDKQMKQQAKNLTQAVKATELNGGMIYRLWREDSTWAHATGFLAGKYAPSGENDTVGVGKPPITDPDLEIHRFVTLSVVFSAGYILAEEGVPSELATAPTVTFHRVR